MILVHSTELAFSLFWMFFLLRYDLLFDCILNLRPYFMLLFRVENVDISLDLHDWLAHPLLVLGEMAYRVYVSHGFSWNVIFFNLNCCYYYYYIIFVITLYYIRQHTYQLRWLHWNLWFNICQRDSFKFMVFFFCTCIIWIRWLYVRGVHVFSAVLGNLYTRHHLWYRVY